MSEENKEEKTEENQQDVNEADPIAEAQAVVKALEEQNKILKEQLTRQEKIMGADIIGGKSMFLKPKVTTENQKEEQEIRKFLEGTGYENMVLPQ